MKDKYLVCSSKVWIPGIANILSEKIDSKFFFIQKKEDLNLTYLKKIKPNKIFFFHWSYIIPEEIYSQYECIVFHMTDLPYGRGGSPLQNLIVRGHKNTKISAIKCSQGIDTGPIYLKKSLSLSGTAQEIYVRANRIMIDMVVNILRKKSSPKKQKGKVTIFKRRTPDMSNLKNIKDLKDLKKTYDIIRMLDAEDYPRAFFNINGIKFEFSDAKLEKSSITAKVRILK